MIIVFTVFPLTYFDQHSDQDQQKQFHLAHNTNDTHHKYSGLKLNILHCLNFLKPTGYVMAFRGRDPVRTKIVIDNKIIEQVNSFIYLGNMISCEKELDIDNKLHNYLKITGILNNVFKPQKTLKKTRIKLYNTLALPVLLYGSETWTIKARDARKITAAELK